MYKLKNYQVVPVLPEKLSFLRELAYNLYWTWDHESRSLFRRLDSDLWEKYNRNPILLLGNIDQEKFNSFANNDGYLSFLSRVKDKIQDYMKRNTWFKEHYAKKQDIRISYFSMEYGITNGLPIYSGGLGILAADHLKSASDLGLPINGIGLLYQQGYFQQYLSRDGWQQETYPHHDSFNLPIKQVHDKNGAPLKIDIDYHGRKVYAQVWKAQVGRIPLFLLDANVPENNPEDKEITAQLYGGDIEMRIKQEILLGIGGIRALEALDLRPDVCHMNEGHSAFLALERTRILMNEKGINFSEALEAVRGGNVFTTHTPVPAGIDEFETVLIDKYLGDMVESMNLPKDQFHKLGGTHYFQTHGKFNMAIFALNFAGACNGVSKLHGQVARKMWHYLWPEIPENEVPIKHITNGIHIRTWISEDLSELFNRYLGPNWYRNPLDESLWTRIDQIPDEELWRTHERRRERLVAITRKRLQKQFENSGASQADIESASEVLDPEALTIGFARRFAQYKRAYLLFKDLDRLSALLNNKEKPVQLIISGKAHPHDKIGKGIMRDILNTIRQENFRNKIVFLENYDMTIAAYLVQGVDVWLNNPRRPREASGTSGMKAGANGALNLSILDGWWDEAYNHEIGWAIGKGEDYTDIEEQDLVESKALYYILEQDVIPTFYKRTKNGLPREWIKMMKENIRQVPPFFNTNRMVRDYFQNFYLSAADQWKKFNADDFKAAKELALWKDNIYKNWQYTQVVNVETENNHQIKVGQKLKLLATIDIKKINPEDILVQVYYGRLDGQGIIETGDTISMILQETLSDGKFLYKAEIPCIHTGNHGYSVRVLPNHPDLHNPHEMGLITWYKE
ncbi:alpha-glucan family phosphorylase [candidate division KSB1 bacterium]|nr:alpha-glucan family phosphorylase [candidate division KSB1 bacterium]